ncbi:MAG: glycosyltransferase family 39 protein [Planctomycetaceae bacterium]
MGTRPLWGAFGLLAVILWCFSPNILAHAQLVTPDVGTTALGVASTYTFWRWLKQPSWARASLAGLTLGFAQLTKSTLVIFFVSWPLLWLVDRLLRRQSLPRREGMQLALLLVLGVYILNLGYGFQGSFNRLDSYQFVSRTLIGTLPEGVTTGNRFTEWGLGFVPVPLPRNYLLGVDYQKKELENRGQRQRSYLHGQWRDHGWWYYYLYAMAIKVPVGTWLLAALACAVRLHTRTYGPQWVDELVLIVPLLAILVLVSSQTGFNHHMRYALPAFPYFFIWISQAGRAFLLAMSKLRMAVAVAMTLSVGSSLWVYPHSLSYFNELVGGPLGGPAHLIDSNIDWGQDLLYLRDWLQAHPEAQPMRIAYFGNISPEIAGMPIETPPGGGPTKAGETDFTVPPEKGETPCDYGPHPGWFAVSVNHLQGVTWNIGADYRYFRRFTPMARAGYSIMIYHITVEQADEVRSDLGLPLLSDCQGQADADIE